MTKYNMSKIMTRAWTIRKITNTEWSTCLKISWAEAKARITSGLTAETIERFEAMGCKRWTKGEHDRLYIKATLLGLELTYYKTGNIHNAEFGGTWISNCEARRLMGEKTYIDIKTGEVHSTHADLEKAARDLYNEVA